LRRAVNIEGEGMSDATRAIQKMKMKPPERSRGSDSETDKEELNK